MSKGTCVKPDCARPTRSLGLCGGHYLAQLAESYPPCRVADCSRRVRSGKSEWCETHYYRIRRNGDPYKVRPSTPPLREKSPHWVGDQVTYIGMHFRIRRVQGSARQYACADCGGGAAEWSYDHADADERESKHGPYSVDMAHYEPRCKSCHTSFDLIHAR